MLGTGSKVKAGCLGRLAHQWGIRAGNGDTTGLNWSQNTAGAALYTLGLSLADPARGWRALTSSTTVTLAVTPEEWCRRLPPSMSKE